MTRLAITADLHIDDYAGIPGRFDDMLRTTRWVAQTARGRQADALIVAGDFTESKTAARAPRVVKIAEALAAGPARQFLLRGNHDQEWQSESIVTDLARTPGWRGFAVPGFDVVGGVAICFIPHLDRSWWRTQPGNEMKPEAQAFRELAEDYLTIARGLYAQAIDVGCSAAILVGHQQLAGGKMTERQQAFLGDVDLVVDARALSAIGYAAVVFGHVHRGQTVIDDPSCPVLFAGSIERVDFAEEGEDKSFVIVDVEPGGPVSIERIPTPARRFVTLSDPGDDYAIAAAHVAGAVVRVVDLDPAINGASVRRELEDLGAFAVTEIRRRPAEMAESAGGLSESLSATEALVAYFAEDPDREAIVELGREILAEVAG